ncbi:MAG: hypothetical protein ACM3SO_20895 [Betaproteobacteria bacterium]
MRRLAAALPALAALAAPDMAASATYVFTTIDYPGAVLTDVRGVNNVGDIVGYASLDGGSAFPFVYSRGNFVALDRGPNGEEVTGHGINDAGVLVGSGQTSGGRSEGFIYQNGSYRFFARPGAGNTYFRAINGAGLVTGYSESFDASGGFLGGTGFIFDPATGIFTDIAVPDSGLVIAQGINLGGTVVGSGQFRPGGAVAFVREPSGAQSYFQISGLSTKARGINSAGLIAGFVEEGGNADQGAPTFTFVGAPPDNRNIRIDGMPQTTGEGINDSGQVVGLFTDAANRTHGFLATPAELPVGTSSGGGFVFSVPVEGFTPVYIDPQVALGYEYRIGNGDPAFASVRLPIGIGDSRYTLIVEGRAYALAGGELFDFRAQGYRNGVAAFRVTDIEAEAALDAANPHAFPTQVSFTDRGRFTGTMIPLCIAGPLPAHAGQALRRALVRCIH